MLALKGQVLTAENGDITRRVATAEDLPATFSDPYLFPSPSFFWSDELRGFYSKLRGLGKWELIYRT